MSLQSQLLADVNNHITKHKLLRKCSKTAKEAFARDITLVAISIRTGYLVDVIYLSEDKAEDIFITLLNELRSISKRFHDVLHLYEPTAAQSFFINIPMLLNKLKLPLHPTVFIELPEKGDPRELINPSQSLVSALQFLQDNLESIVKSKSSQHTLRLPMNMPSTTSIPLTAVLLEYPIAYVPTSEEQTSFLGNVSLFLYKCCLQLNDTTSITLLQFSCPVILVDGGTIPNIKSHLENTFQPRITKCFPDATFIVQVQQTILDRVAL